MKTLLFLLTLHQSALASDITSRTQCSNFVGKQPFSWCLTQPEEPSSEILYILHGMGGNERLWLEETELKSLRNNWTQLHRKEPWIVAIDFHEEGEPWALEDNLRDIFVNQVMPKVESTIPTKIMNRSVLGFSMNGFSVFQLWFKNPELFQKFAALCPAVTEPEVKKQSLFDSLFRVLAGVSPGDAPEKSAKIWAAHDPMVLAKLASPQTKSKPLFLNYNEYDDFNFNSGTEKFLKMNTELKLNVISIKAKRSGHCENLDYAALAQFL